MFLIGKQQWCQRRLQLRHGHDGKHLRRAVEAAFGRLGWFRASQAHFGHRSSVEGISGHQPGAAVSRQSHPSTHHCSQWECVIVRRSYPLQRVKADAILARLPRWQQQHSHAGMHLEYGSESTRDT